MTTGKTLARLRMLAGLIPQAGPVGVMDVGANPIEGKAPYAPLLKAGLARVTGFEPQPEPLARLNKVKSSAETYHPVALGDGNPGQLRLFKHSGFTSLFPIDPKASALIGFSAFTEPAGDLAVETTRLDDLPDVGPIDYLKIDVQGAEAQIIAHGRKALAGAVMIQTEVRFVPLYSGEPGFAALHGLLEDMGFHLHDVDFVKRASLRSASFSLLRPWPMRRIVDGDAFYVRDLRGIDSWSDAQILHLAMLADAVIDDPNLVVFCLDALVGRNAIPASAVGDYARTRRSLADWFGFLRGFRGQWKVRGSDPV